MNMSTDWDSDVSVQVWDPDQTDEDSDYLPATEQQVKDSPKVQDKHSSNIDGYVHITPTKRRQRKRLPNEWKRSTAKRLRIEGKQYFGRTNKVISARDLKEYIHVCRYQCNGITEDERRQLFTEFYELSSYDLQTSFLSSCLKQIEPIRHKASTASSKTYSTIITLLDKRVCKQMFLYTFDISARRFQVVCKKTQFGITEPDMRGKKEPSNKIKESVKKFVISHINMFPRYCSHYYRKENPNAKHPSGELNINTMYKLYKEFCIEKQEEPVKESYYRLIFNTEFNLQFHKPYSDICSRSDNLQNLLKNFRDEQTINNTKEKP